MRIGLVGCVKTKRDHAAPARELYTSPLFIRRRAFVERSCDEWYVLSALHGLVSPDEVLEPYDATLNDASIRDRRAWSARVFDELREALGDLTGQAFEVHAGRNYWGYGLRERLERAGAIVENPTEGLPFGKQLSFYQQSS